MTTLAQLNDIADSIYNVLKGDSTYVYRDYEKIPVSQHEQIYAAAGIEKMVFENCIMGESGKYFSGKYSVRIRILGTPDTGVDELYNTLDEILDRVDYGGFSVNRIEIMPPLQDRGLRRFVLECNIQISGKSEVLNELQS